MVQLSRTYQDLRYKAARRIEIVSRFSRDECLDRTGSRLVELVCFNEMPLQVYIKYSIVRIKQRINTDITKATFKHVKTHGVLVEQVEMSRAMSVTD